MLDELKIGGDLECHDAMEAEWVIVLTRHHFNGGAESGAPKIGEVGKIGVHATVHMVV
jgi:hypothetical protein